MQTIFKEQRCQFFGDIPFVRKKASEYALQYVALLNGLSVVHVSLGDHEIQYFTLVVHDNVQFETVEPAHGRPSRGGYTVKHLVRSDTFVLTDPYRGGVHKGYTCALP